MKILAIDTATEACSAALLVGGHVTERYEVLGRGHAEHVLPMVDSLLAEAGIALATLDAIAFGRGPGAFTGVRIAVSVVQGLAFGADLPVVPVSDLAALAARAAVQHDARRVLACMDARMQQVYWAVFDVSEPARPVALTTEQVTDPAQVALPDGTPCFGAGHGFAAYPGLRDGVRPLSVLGWPVDQSPVPGTERALTPSLNPG
jgi:tRNA threonylcarbamoyladenosine biosynthesis protein TsaB